MAKYENKSALNLKLMVAIMLISSILSQGNNLATVNVSGN